MRAVRPILIAAMSVAAAALSPAASVGAQVKPNAPTTGVYVGIERLWCVCLQGDSCYAQSCS